MYNEPNRAFIRDFVGPRQLLPFEDGLPEKYRPSKLKLDEEALLRDFIRPYFEQRSFAVKPNETLEINSVRFKAGVLEAESTKTRSYRRGRRRAAAWGRTRASCVRAWP